MWQGKAFFQTRGRRSAKRLVSRGLKESSFVSWCVPVSAFMRVLSVTPDTRRDRLLEVLDVSVLAEDHSRRYP